MSEGSPLVGQWDAWQTSFVVRVGREVISNLAIRIGFNYITGTSQDHRGSVIGSYDETMKLITADDVDGKISVPPGIDEGSRVAILKVDDEKPVVLSATEEAELGEAVAKIDSGHYVDGWALLKELKTKSQGCNASVAAQIEPA